MHPTTPLSLSEFLFDLRLRGIRLADEGGELRIDAPRGSLLPDDIALLRLRKPEILQRLERTDAAESTVLTQFDKIARLHPERIALVMQEQRVTYAELDRRSNQLARYLQARGGMIESRIGVWLPRGIERIVCMLAAMKAGGAYVALGDDWPAERIAALCGTSALQILLAPAIRIEQMQVFGENSTLLVDFDAAVKEFDNEPVAGIGIDVHPRQLAYVIFTSGSSGTPKGVQVEHRSLAALVDWHKAEYIGDTAGKVHASHAASTAFDAHIWEIFPYLCAGATLHIVAERHRTDPQRLVAWLESAGITHCFLATPMAEVLLRSGMLSTDTLECLLVGGDVLKYTGENALPFRLVNHYGPTETTVVATFSHVLAESVLPPIGLPIDPVSAFVGDSAISAAPSGITGELYLGGVAVARGYLANPRETAVNFVPDVDGEPGSRRYRTGDVVQVLADRQLKFVERIDTQMKVRGIRVEPAEIERRLLEDRRVAEAVVVKHESTDDTLVAFCTLDSQARGHHADAFVEDWRALYDATYGSTATEMDVEFVGWHSSFDGAPIDAQQMEEWATSTARRIGELSPRRLLEIGAGTGILMFRLLPMLERYAGCDISIRSVECLHERLSRLPDELRNRASIAHAAADAIGQLDMDSCDTVVMNSLCQYFPDGTYFESALNAALEQVRNEGSLFIGDVRDLRLMEAFHAAVASARCPASARVGDLREAISDGMRRDSELLASPAFFSHWASGQSRVRDILVMPKLSPWPNEMTRFRFDVVISLDASPEPSHEFEIFAWADGCHAEAQQLSDILASDVATFEIRAIPLKFTVADLAWSRRLSDLELDPRQSIVELAPMDHATGVDPVALIQQCESAGWRARALLNGQLPGHFVLQATRAGNWPPTPALADTGEPLCNEPWQDRMRENVAGELRDGLKRILPEYMVPARIVALEALPLTENGKIDRRRLATIPLPHRDHDGAVLATPVERLVGAWWTEALGLPVVGRSDNFFDLGGHSLLAIHMVGKIGERTGIEMPVHLVLENPILADFAASLTDWLGGDETARQIVELLEDETAATESRSAVA